MMRFKGMLAVVATLLVLTLMVPMVSAQSTEDDDNVNTPSGIDTNASTGVNIQNVGDGTATLDVNLYPQSGGSAIPLSAPQLGAGELVNFFLPALTEVPGGQSYSLVATADQPIEAIVRTDFGTSASGIYSSVPSGNEVVVPLITRNFAGQSSQITVQNASTDQSTTYDVVLVGLGQTIDSPAQTISGETLGASLSKTYDLNAISGLPDNGADLNVATGFAGFAVIRVTSGAPVVVQSFIDIVGQPAVTSFSGVPFDSAATTLYAPLVRASFFGDTGIQIVNPNSSPANVNITFITNPATEIDADPTYSQSLEVPANSSAIAFQGPSGNSRTAGLPDQTPTVVGVPDTNGWLGSAEITSDQPILAVVNDVLFANASFDPGRQSTYNVPTADNAGTEFALPLVRSGHVAGAFLTTGVQVQNITDQEVTATLNVTNNAGDTGAPQQVNIPANGSVNFFQGTAAFAGLFPDVAPELGGAGWFGSGTLSATGNVVVVVNDENFSSDPANPITSSFDSANYNGLLKR